MSDIIQLLPDSVANQIAAGEVIQRPASVVKELVENALDSGATSITVIVKNAGKSLIQVIDNGCGMSQTDARIAFERHATSKINKASDLFAIRTMGFRGEALASIAAIAQVELRTKRIEDELGVCIKISGSTVESQDVISCSNGSNFAVKNLFFNVPARRKFLKANSTELRHIISEVQRIALPNPQIGFVLTHNDSEIYRLTPSNMMQRIIGVFNKNKKQRLVPVQTDTTIVKIRGYVGKPEFSRKSSNEQFFFVNGRYMRSAYFHKSVIIAYQKLLPPDTSPSYFVFLDTDPARIDINIHPTKTEIKFEEGEAVFQIILAIIREALGKFNIVPSIDFDTKGKMDMPVVSKDTVVVQPVVDIDDNFNPFEKEKKITKKNYVPKSALDSVPDDWENLYDGLVETQPQQQNIFEDTKKTESDQPKPNVLQLQNKFILTTVKSGVMIIDQQRAHERILYEQFEQAISNQKGLIQKSLYPLVIELDAIDFEIMMQVMAELRAIGFDIEQFGNQAISVSGIPAEFEAGDPQHAIFAILEKFKTYPKDLIADTQQRIAASMAKVASISSDKMLQHSEMKEIIDRLFACQIPNYTPDGKTVLTILKNNEIQEKF